MSDPDAILRQAIAMQQAGTLADAEYVFRNALASGIDHKNMYVGLASVCEAQGRSQEARNALEDAAGKYPDEPSVLSNLGGVMIRMGDPEGAIPLLMKATALAPDFTGAYQNLAVAYAEIKKWKRAKAAAEVALSVDPNIIVMLKLVATVATETGQFAQGLATYDRLAALNILTYNPPVARPSLNLANAFTRAAPSPRYAALSEQYELIHKDGKNEGGNTFTGVVTFLRVAPFIQERFHGKRLETVLDYGGGQGRQYEVSNLRDRDGKTYRDIAAYLGVKSVDVYDAGRPETTSTLDNRYDAVICTDVLEHCDQQDLPWIVRELFEHANKAVFATIATYPAVKHLPNGENAHCTLEPADWWSSLFVEASRDFPAVDFAYLVVNDKGFENVEAFAGGPNAGTVGL